MRTAPSQEKQTKANSLAGQFSFLTVGLTVTGLLAIRFYFVRELLTIFATMAVLFAGGTVGLLLLVVLQEIGRWIVLGIGLTKRVTVISQRTQISSELTQFAVPKAIEGKTGIWIGSEARQCDIGKMTTILLKRLVVN